MYEFSVTYAYYPKEHSIKNLEHRATSYNSHMHSASDLQLNSPYTDELHCEAFCSSDTIPDAMIVIKNIVENWPFQIQRQVTLPKLQIAQDLNLFKIAYCTLLGSKPWSHEHLRRVARFSTPYAIDQIRIF